MAEALPDRIVARLRELGAPLAAWARAHRAAGLPIGSGPVESAGKHLVQLRLKRPGARWSEPGAAALLALRAQRASTLPAAA